MIYPVCFPGSSVGKDSACNAGDPSSIPGSHNEPVLSKLLAKTVSETTSKQFAETIYLLR